MRSQPDRRDPAQLAIPARPANRRLRRFDPPFPQLNVQFDVPNFRAASARLVGYRMPAEWEPHLATYLVWPHNLDTWPGKFEPIPLVFAQMAAAIAQFEPVRMLLRDFGEAPPRRAAVDESVAAMLGSAACANEPSSICRVPTNDSWIRDHGPIFVNRTGARRRTCPDRARLALQFVGRKIRQLRPSTTWYRGGWANDMTSRWSRPKIVLEGGSIEVNGAGSLLTTESCLLNPQS